jgi:hypothetical protein
MKTYYYVHTGHRIGLDRFRRASAIFKALKGVEMTLLSSDYRIAQIAREYGIENAVGVDVVRNIPYIAENGDRLIFDSDEANPIMLEDMKNYFSTFLHLKSDDIAVDVAYFEKCEKSVAMTYFFGDDDYEKDLEKNLDFLKGFEPYLQLGFYYFLDYEEMLKERFKNYFEFEEYEEMIKKTDILITASPQAVLESLATGGRPIYVKRADYGDDFDKLFESLNIPIVDNFNSQHLKECIDEIKEIKYINIAQLSNKTIELIKDNFNL